MGRLGNRFQDTWLARLPVPLPAPYVQGADAHWGDFYSGRISYLHGVFRQHGWWYYYLYGFLVMTPLGVLLLVPVALVLRLRRGVGSSWRDELLVLAPSLAMLALVSAHSQCTQNVRYALPALPGLLVWVSAAAGATTGGRPWTAVLIWGLVAWAIASSVRWLPHSLAYFNEWTGIPADGERHLRDSNLDWGQELFRLKQWTVAHPQRRPLYVAYSGPTTVHLAGIEADDTTLGHAPLSPATMRSGWYVMSVNYLHGYGWVGVQPQRDERFASFRNLAPVERIGQTLYVYYVPPE